MGFFGSLRCCPSPSFVRDRDRLLLSERLLDLRLRADDRLSDRSDLALPRDRDLDLEAVLFRSLLLRVGSERRRQGLLAGEPSLDKLEAERRLEWFLPGEDNLDKLEGLCLASPEYEISLEDLLPGDDNLGKLVGLPLTSCLFPSTISPEKDILLGEFLRRVDLDKLELESRREEVLL